MHASKSHLIRIYYDFMSNPPNTEELRPTTSSHNTSSLHITTETLTPRTIMNLTIKNTFLLLALFVSAVGANHLEYARVEGVNAEGVDFCSTSVYDELYQECIVTIAEAHDVTFDNDRRLELRGSRSLWVCAVCPPEAISMKGHWCNVVCGHGTRRLQGASDNASDHANENADATTHAIIEEEATECYIKKAKKPEGNVTCLGDWEKISVTINYH
jgi:hypothetical protein